MESLPDLLHRSKSMASFRLQIKVASESCYSVYNHMMISSGWVWVEPGKRGRDVHPSSDQIGPGRLFLSFDLGVRSRQS